MKVIAHLNQLNKLEFSAENEMDARDRIKSIVNNGGVWIDNFRTFYPINQISKLEIIK